MLEKVGVAVIGAGYFGRYHAKVFQRLPNVDLCGVYDVVAQSAEAVASETGTRVYRSLDEVFEDRRVQAVSLCVSDQAHLEPALAACAAGKHLLIEKPLATTLEDCDAIIEAARKAGVKLMVGHILRFDPRYRIACERIADGQIGEIIQFYARRSNPIIAARRLGDRCGKYTIIYHNAVHDLDLMLWMGGTNISQAFALKREGLLTSEGIDVADAVVSTMAFENGAIGLMENCWTLPESHPVLIDTVFEVTGTKGKIVIDAREQGLVVFTEGACEHTDTMYWPEYRDGIGGALKEELAAFVDCIVEDRPVPVSGEEGRKAVEAVHKIVKALEAGQV